MPAKKPPTRKMNAWQRLKHLVTGVEPDLERQRHDAYLDAKARLQAMVEEGKMTAEELRSQLILLRNGHGTHVSPS